MGLLGQVLGCVFRCLKLLLGRINCLLHLLYLPVQFSEPMPQHAGKTDNGNIGEQQECNKKLRDRNPNRKHDSGSRSQLEHAFQPELKRRLLHAVQVIAFWVLEKEDSPGAGGSPLALSNGLGWRGAGRVVFVFGDEKKGLKRAKRDHNLEQRPSSVSVSLRAIGGRHESEGFTSKGGNGWKAETIKHILARSQSVQVACRPVA